MFHENKLLFKKQISDFNKTVFLNLFFLDKIARNAMLLGLCFDLSGHLGLRTLLAYPSFLYLFLRNIFNYKDTSRFFFLIFIFGIVPLVQLIRTYIVYTPNDFIISQFMSTFQMIFIYICLKSTDGRTLLKEFVNCIFIVQITALILFFGGLLGNPFLTKIIHQLGAPFNGGYFGFLLVDGYTVPQLYFRATLFYIFPSIYYFSEKKYLKSLISIAILILALSKAGTVLSMLGILMLIIKRKKIYDVFFVLIIIILIVSFGESYLNNYLELKDSYTAQVRTLQIDWFKNWVLDSPLSFVFGMGLGTDVFVPKYGMASALELDHLDTIRKYGVLWFLIVVFLILKITLRSFFKKGNFGITIAYFFTFLGVGTNPVFLTSLFFILTLIIYKLNYE
jgi:hypothetical protein